MHQDIIDVASMHQTSSCAALMLLMFLNDYFAFAPVVELYVHLIQYFCPQCPMRPVWCLITPYKNRLKRLVLTVIVSCIYDVTNSDVLSCQSDATIKSND